MRPIQASLLTWYPVRSLPSAKDERGIDSSTRICCLLPQLLANLTGGVMFLPLTSSWVKKFTNETKPTSGLTSHLHPSKMLLLHILPLPPFLHLRGKRCRH
ncbi:hypothetical protein L596_013554 [Steinernema carpocapsae]|uniref:Uncharacterized protein n=1 Tax=Steinernema carpocapsae TaxID=34508 RepID=A0A4U5P1D7_STECR|nr:hypothetical protein L596_013554 [Steinernema carpocapsae]